MEAFGYWKYVVSLLVMAIVHIGEGKLQCSLTCPNQQVSCITELNKQFQLQGHSAVGQVRNFHVYFGFLFLSQCFGVEYPS